MTKVKIILRENILYALFLCNQQATLPSTLTFHLMGCKQWTCLRLCYSLFYTFLIYMAAKFTTVPISINKTTSLDCVLICNFYAVGTFVTMQTRKILFTLALTMESLDSLNVIWYIQLRYDTKVTLRQYMIVLQCDIYYVHIFTCCCGLGYNQEEALHELLQVNLHLSSVPNVVIALHLLCFSSNYSRF